MWDIRLCIKRPPDTTIQGEIINPLQRSLMHLVLLLILLLFSQKINTKQVRFYKNKCLRVYTHLLKVLTYSNTCSLTAISSLKHFWLWAQARSWLSGLWTDSMYKSNPRFHFWSADSSSSIVFWSFIQQERFSFYLYVL